MAGAALAMLRCCAAPNRLPYASRFCGGVIARAAHSGKSKSSSRWLERQSRDQYTLKAKAEGYKSRAAYKLKEINAKYKLFRPGQTVVDLGYAPGSWSQVAVEATQPGGRVIGVDLLFVEPPEGVTTIQGNFLDPGVQLEMETILAAPDRGRYVPEEPATAKSEESESASLSDEAELAQETAASTAASTAATAAKPTKSKRKTTKADVVLSDMMANTSGVVARDHSTSIDLCDAALIFSIKNLRYRGSFVCKFYTGTEDRLLEARLKKVFKRVERVNPDASRSESRESYFVALNKQKVTSIEAVFAE